MKEKNQPRGKVFVVTVGDRIVYADTKKRNAVNVALGARDAGRSATVSRVCQDIATLERIREYAV